MGIEQFLQTVFQVSVAVAFTALCVAAVVVSVYYSYKMADGLIRRRDRILSKIKRSRVFGIDKPALRMVKEERKRMANK
jgi:ABC-type molybdate transport system permease subunit